MLALLKQIYNNIGDAFNIIAIIVILFCAAILVWGLTWYRRKKNRTIIWNVSDDNSREGSTILAESRDCCDDKIKVKYKQSNIFNIFNFSLNKEFILKVLYEYFLIIVTAFIMACGVILSFPVVAIFIPIINYKISNDIKELKLINNFLLIPSIIVTIVLFFYSIIANSMGAYIVAIVLLVFCGISSLGMTVAEKIKSKGVEEKLNNKPKGISLPLITALVVLLIVVFYLFNVLILTK